MLCTSLPQLNYNFPKLITDIILSFKYFDHVYIVHTVIFMKFYLLCMDTETPK